MGYELLGDVKTVTLGGVNKTTGKKNPTELEGYYLRVEGRPNKFNKDKPQNFYVFQTKEGEVGLYGKAGLDREMKKAVAGRMTKVINTGKTVDTGMGNPMIVFQVMQDRSNTINVDEFNPPTPTQSAGEHSDDDGEGGWAPSGEDELEDITYEEVGEDIPPPRATAPRQPASAPSADRQARVQALLSKGRSKTS